MKQTVHFSKTRLYIHSSEEVGMTLMAGLNCLKTKSKPNGENFKLAFTGRQSQEPKSINRCYV